MMVGAKCASPQAAHVHHEVAVAMHGATLREPHLVVARFPDFGDGVGHGGWRHELALLDVHRLAGVGCRDKKVGLAAQEGRNLEHVGHFRRHGGFFRVVDVRHDAHPQFRFDLGEDVQRLLVADARKRIESCAVGLAVTGFHMKRQPKLVAHALDLLGHGHGGLEAFDGTRAGEHVQGRNGSLGHGHMFLVEGPGRRPDCPKARCRSNPIKRVHLSSPGMRRRVRWKPRP